MTAEPDHTTRLPFAPDARRARRRRELPSAAGPTTALHQLNSMLGILLLGVLALAPVPLGSNRPAFWTLWAAIVGLVALGYGVALFWLQAPNRLSLRRFWPEFIGFALILGWLCLQLLPIGAHLPGAMTLVPGIGGNASTISLDPGSTAMSLLNFATYGVLFALVMEAGANRRRARTLLRGLYFIVVVSAVYGLLSLVQFGDTLLGVEKLYYRGSATGTFINRNSYATLLAAGLAMGVPLLLCTTARVARPRSWIRPVLVLLGLLFIAATLLATNSRMGAAAGLIGAVAAVALSLWKGEAGRLRWWLAGALALAAVIVVGLYGSSTVGRYVLGDDTLGRSELYRQIWPAILERPLTGYGGGSFATVFPTFQHAPLAGDTVWEKAHSTYLALWFEMGLVAGSIPLLIVGSLALRAIRSLGDPSSRTISIAAIAVTIVFALHSLVDFSAEIMANALLFTAVLALGAAGAAPAGTEER